MIARPVRIVAVLGLLAVALAAATSERHAPHRTPPDGSPPAPVTTSVQQIESDAAHREVVRRASIENHGRFRLGVVEFDDQGRFWSRAQYDQVIADLREVYKANAGVQAIVFAHGWKHSASVCDGNLTCFRELLASFAEQEGESGRPVYGVYLGWRGLSIKAPLLKELTFWSRKATAHRIGNADVVEMLATLETMHRQERRESPGTRLTTIGHSFGGAVIYSALSGSLKERLAVHVASSSQPRSLLVGFGTLTLLVNPAFEASLYDGIDRMIRHNAGAFDPRNPRVLVTVASEGDTATRVLFPAGRWISTLLQRTRGGDQKAQMLRTAGNYRPFATHRLDLPTAAATTAAPAAAGECRCQTSIREAFTVNNAAFLAAAATADDEEYFGRTRLTRIADSPQAGSPCILVRADRAVIADHNDIWSTPFVEFMASLITRTDALLAR
jgi:hypothetical protein